MWNSPWGKIGICICYDLSYTRVTDRLVKLGAEAIIVPTMDMVDWGVAQHELHTRIAPVRAAEYGLPIFRLASSGISQSVDRAGQVTATAPCPGDGAILTTTLEMRGQGSRPLDRWLAPFRSWRDCGPDRLLPRSQVWPFGGWEESAYPVIWSARGPRVCDRDTGG